MDYLSRESLINNYITIVQFVFSLFIAVIFFQYQNYDFEIWKFEPRAAIEIGSVLILTFFGGLLLVKKPPPSHKNLINLGYIILNVIVIIGLYRLTYFYYIIYLFIVPMLIATIQFRKEIYRYIIFIISLIVIALQYLVYQSRGEVLVQEVLNTVMLALIFSVVCWTFGNLLNEEGVALEHLVDSKKTLTTQDYFLEQLVNKLPLAVLVIDNHGKIKIINTSVLDIINVHQSENEFKNKQLLENQPVVEGLQQFYNSRLKEFLFLDPTTKCKEKVTYSNKLIEISSFPVYSANGQMANRVIMVSDITKEELAREKVNHLSKLNLVGQVAAGIAHEVRNPLTIIRGFLQLAQKRQINLSNQELNLLLSEIDRGNGILMDFLSVAKKTVREKELLNLREIVEEQVVFITNDAAFRGIKLKLAMEEVPDLLLDKNEIKQLFLNLSRNAVEAMETGGTLSIGLIKTKASIVLEVLDTGVGISEEIINKLGTPFVTTKARGTGLGFTTCKQIAESHGASIDIQSKTGAGTKITVKFPLLKG